MLLFFSKENLNPATESIAKLSLSASDREIMNSDPVFKETLYKLDGLYLNSTSESYGPFGTQTVSMI